MNIKTDKMFKFRIGLDAEKLGLTEIADTGVELLTYGFNRYVVVTALSEREALAKAKITMRRKGGIYKLLSEKAYCVIAPGHF